MTRLITLCLACLAPASRGATKRVAFTDPALISAYTRLLKIFGIGYWGKEYMVLTLTDAGDNT
jgi:hypothetical protein